VNKRIRKKKAKQRLKKLELAIRESLRSSLGRIKLGEVMSSRIRGKIRNKTVAERVRAGLLGGEEFVFSKEEYVGEFPAVESMLVGGIDHGSKAGDRTVVIWGHEENGKCVFDGLHTAQPEVAE